MANIRSTTGSLLGTVTSMASTATSLITTAENSLQLVSNRVNHSLKEQEMRLKLEAVTLKEKLLDESAIETAERKEELLKKLAGSTSLSDNFLAQRKLLEDALK